MKLNKELFFTGVSLIAVSVILSIGTIRGSKPEYIEEQTPRYKEIVNIELASTMTEHLVIETEECIEEEVSQELVEVSQEISQAPIQDIELLARVITAEAGGSCYEMQYLVGVVVINRINYSYWGNTLEDVIYAGGQYACTHKLPYTEPTEIAWSIAEDLLTNGHNEPSNVIWQAEFTQGNGIYKQIDNMYFCYKEGI